VRSAARKGNPSIQDFDTSVFDGNYVTGDVTQDYLDHIEAQRNDASQEARRKSDSTIIELHNSA